MSVVGLVHGLRRVLDVPTGGTSIAVLGAVLMLTGAVLLWPPSVRSGLVRRAARWRRASPAHSSIGVDGRRGARRPEEVRRRRTPTIAPSVVLRVVEDLSTQVRAGVDPDRAWVMAWQLSAVGLVDGGRPRGVEWLGGATASGARRAEDAEGAGRAAPDEAWILPGERPVDAARRMAREPGADASMVALAAAWRLSEDVGAPLADVLAIVADGVRQDAEIAAEIEAELAAPRATARLLAVLPVAGLGLGQAIGAHPLGVLAGTAAGRWCAVGGLVLALAGHGWTRWLVRRAERLV